MTKTISSPSASTTTKAKVAKAATSGLPQKSIETYSVDTSKVKRWYVTFMDGRVACFDVRGEKDGRISFSRGQHGNGGELRIYRDAAGKVFDAVITDVKHVQSEFVEAREVIGAPSVERKAEAEDLMAKANSLAGSIGVGTWTPRAKTRPVIEPPPLPYELLSPIEQDELDEATKGT